MENWVAITREEERILLRWLIREIITLLKMHEQDGEREFKYLTKLKLTKILFLVAEECNLDITRAWYRYGGWICAPFDLHEAAREFYYNQTSINQEEDNLVKEKLKTRLREIKEEIEVKFRKIFFKKTEEFLEYFYEDNAPAEYKGKYIAFRRFIRYFEQFTTPQTTLENLILPKGDPSFWNKPQTFIQLISKFQVELTDILPEKILLELVDFTGLLEQTAILISWKKKQNLPITSKDYALITKLKTAFTEKGWGLIATYIAVNTVHGVRGEEKRAEFKARIMKREEALTHVIKKQENRLKHAKLLPSLDILKEFFNAKYREMYEEANREGPQWVMN